MEQDPTLPDPPTRRSAVSSKVAGALIGAIAALSIGGVGLAFAQEAATPTTEAPAVTTPDTATPTPATPGDDCPDHAGRGGGGGGGGSTTDTPSDTSADAASEV
jgi:hypothetical protein